VFWTWCSGDSVGVSPGRTQICHEFSWGRHSCSVLQCVAVCCSVLQCVAGDSVGVSPGRTQICHEFSPVDNMDSSPSLRGICVPLREQHESSQKPKHYWMCYMKSLFWEFWRVSFFAFRLCVPHVPLWEGHLWGLMSFDFLWCRATYIVALIDVARIDVAHHTM